MNCTFPSWLDSFIALYPREILTECGGVVDDWARRRRPEKFLIKALKGGTCSLTIPTAHTLYCFTFAVKFNLTCSFDIFKIIQGKCATALKGVMSLAMKMHQWVLVNLELLALLLHVLVIRYSDGQAPLLAIFWTEPRSGGPTLSTWLVGSDVTLLAPHVEAEAILSFVYDNVRL